MDFRNNLVIGEIRDAIVGGQHNLAHLTADGIIRAYPKLVEEFSLADKRNKQLFNNSWYQFRTYLLRKLNLAPAPTPASASTTPFPAPTAMMSNMNLNNEDFFDNDNEQPSSSVRLFETPGRGRVPSFASPGFASPGSTITSNTVTSKSKSAVDVGKALYEMALRNNGDGDACVIELGCQFSLDLTKDEASRELLARNIAAGGLSLEGSVGQLTKYKADSQKLSNHSNMGKTYLQDVVYSEKAAATSASVALVAQIEGRKKMIQANFELAQAKYEREMEETNSDLEAAKNQETFCREDERWTRTVVYAAIDHVGKVGGDVAAVVAGASKLIRTSAPSTAAGATAASGAVAAMPPAPASTTCVGFQFPPAKPAASTTCVGWHYEPETPAAAPERPGVEGPFDDGSEF